MTRQTHRPITGLPDDDLAARAIKAARNRDADAAALALQLMHRDPLVHPHVAGAAFGYGPDHSYRVIRAGKIPSVRVGGLREGAVGRIRVPSAAVLRMLGYDVQVIGAQAATENTSTSDGAE